MPAIQDCPDELNYANAKISENPGAESFLNSFLNACLRADGENYPILRPALHFFMSKYPARPDRLKAEEIDSNPRGET